MTNSLNLSVNPSNALSIGCDKIPPELGWKFPMNPDNPSPPRKVPVKDPPIVVFKDEFNDPLEQVWKSLLATLSEPAYGAQRVFDLFTLMAITLAFGLLFGLLKALGAIPEVFFSVTAFVTFVAIGQMLLFGGNSPRLASLAGGPIALALTIVCLSIWYGRLEIVQIVCSLPLGVPGGYLAGGMVAGVFLIADMLRDKFTRSKDEVEHSFWDEEN